VDNVAQQHQPARAVIINEGEQPEERVVRRGERQNLAARAMGPGVAEMEIGDGEQVFVD
jgi:hypothetical protein